MNKRKKWQANDNLEKTAGALDEKFSMVSWSWFIGDECPSFREKDHGNY